MAEAQQAAEATAESRSELLDQVQGALSAETAAAAALQARMAGLEAQLGDAQAGGATLREALQVRGCSLPCSHTQRPQTCAIACTSTPVLCCGTTSMQEPLV